MRKAVNVLKLASLAIGVENFAVVTHRVPAHRVRRRLPPIYELQTHSDDDGEWCFISVTCFCNRDFRWAVVPYPRHTFNECTYRTYVTCGSDVGVYFFGRFLSTTLAVAAQKLTSRDLWKGDFDVRTEFGPKGYASYVCRIASRRGETTFALAATDEPGPKGPFTTGDEHAQFITFRPNGYLTSSIGVQAVGVVEHPPMDPYEGTLRSGSFPLWRELGFVTDDEMDDAFSVLVSRRVPFLLQMPIPIVRARASPRPPAGRKIAL
ncbi:MAG: DUF2071 domain-containing protein [Actinomycetota bacterium]|nr:DUF2071 domain-containing protein [Actinomycetota bacterium]